MHMMQSPHGEVDFASEAKKLFGLIPLALKALWGSRGRGGKISQTFTFFFAGNRAIRYVDFRFSIADCRFTSSTEGRKGSDR